MASLEEFLDQWKDARDGFIKEVDLLPADRLDFRATPETRSVLELIHHVVEAERVLAGEVCREDTNFRREPFPALVARYAGQVKEAGTKEALIELMKGSFQETRKLIQDFGEEKLEQLTARFDGKQITKRAMLHFTLSHEMYHRGQLTVYQRLSGIEPELTRQFKKLLGQK